MRYATRLRKLTDDQRWLEGFAYRIDQKADAALAEIKEMADKARDELRPPLKSVPFDNRMLYLQMLNQYQPQTLEERVARLEATRNIFNPMEPQMAYRTEATNIGNFFGQMLGWR